MNKEQIIKDYESLELGRGHTKLNLGPYFADDFLDQGKLVKFIEEYQDGEAYLTKEGYRFLLEYYGIEELASILSKLKPEFPYGDKETVLEWFEHFYKGTKD